MTLDVAFALSLPIALAIFFGLRAVARALRKRDRAVAPRVAPEPATVAHRRVLEAMRDDDRVRQMFPPRPRDDDATEPLPRNLFAEWLDSGGRKKPQDVQDQVEWAFDYLAGDDSGSEAGEHATQEGAVEILDRLAGRGWAATAIAEAQKRR